MFIMMLYKYITLKTVNRIQNSHSMCVLLLVIVLIDAVTDSLYIDTLARLSTLTQYQSQHPFITSATCASR